MPDALRPLVDRPVLGLLVLVLVCGALGGTVGLAAGLAVYRRIVGAARKKGESIERGATRLARDAVAAWEAAHGKRPPRSTMLPPSGADRAP